MNRYKRPRHRTTFTNGEIAFAGVMRGCRCRPDFRRRHENGHAAVDVVHDYDCPILDREPQLLLRRGSHQTAADFASDVLEVLRALQGRESA